MNNVTRPVVYHGRIGHKLSSNNNPLTSQLNNFESFAVKNQMKINYDKTSIMTFNRSKTLDFQPEIFLGGELLNVLDSAKILGTIIDSNMKCSKNISYICKRARGKIWMLRRIREIGGSLEDMLLVYMVQIRVITEQSCQAWNGALLKKDIEELENIQKSVAKILLGSSYKGYENALTTLGLQSLEERREKLCISFARKAAKSDKFSPWFQKTKRETRNNLKYELPHTRTAAFERSPLIYLTHLLNK